MSDEPKIKIVTRLPSDLYERLARHTMRRSYQQSAFVTDAIRDALDLAEAAKLEPAE